MEFEELLKKLAEACGIERLEPDESHMVHLGADGTALTIVGEPETRMVVLFSEIGELPIEGRERFYEVALKANWLFQGGGGATLAINPDTNVLALNRALPMAALDGDRFVELVRGFLVCLARWRQLATDWRGAVEDDAVRGADGEPVSEDPLAALRNDQIIRG